ncbi:AraC family transcriptional regulator [Corallococcus exercitus]|uniref:GyrI-like domain-containing protein n=1 Tax=Corallococcus exercitus TaxID=2316736 RepID=UPI000EA14E1B|nr:GyrI-like domain-containing protein [Corallococcus exercitus]RKG78587.1 AraC family transcriptional regulator [Corallococcus exercitus]
MTSVSVVRLPAMIVVGLQVTGTYEALRQRIPQAWAALLSRLPELPQRVDPDVFLKVEPQGADLRGPNRDELTCWVGVEVRAIEEAPPGMSAIHVPAGDYATTRVMGEPAAVNAAAWDIFQWVRHSGRSLSIDAPGPERNAAYAVERYDPRRQREMPPAAPFDYDLFKALA